MFHFGSTPTIDIEPHFICSILSHNAPDDADDLGIGAVDGLVVVIFRHEPDLAVPAAQALDGGLVTDPGDDDLAIYTYEDNRTFKACMMLMERGVYVNPVISPATPVGQSLLRTSYTATHTKEQMEYCAKQIKEVLELLPFEDKELEARVKSEENK